MPFQNLPTEIIEWIAEYLHHSGDLNALCRVNRHSYAVLNWYLYHRDAQRPCKALLWGSHTGNLQVMQRSLDHGADIHRKDFDDKTPLIKAVEGQSLEAIRFLLAKGADIHYSNSYADSITFAAVFTRNVEVVKLVLAYGANPDARSYAHTRPLSLAVSRGEFEIASALVKNGACLYESDPEYYTPLMTVLTEARHDILKMFIENGVFHHDKDGSLGANALRRAVLTGNSEAVDILLSAGANAARNGWNGRCAIMDAVSTGNVDLAISLSESVVDLKELKDKDGEGLFHYAVASGSQRYVRYLLGRGFSPDNINRTGLSEGLDKMCRD
ncbi:hypothetical protein ACLX1H_000866 [Fusarium chlamydosporum]